MSGDAAHHRRRVAGAGADLQHLVAGAELGELDHAGDDVGLGNGLPGLDGERGILVSELGQWPGHEGLARDFAHGREHVGIGDAAGFEMPRHHEGAVAGVDVVPAGLLRIEGCHGAPPSIRLAPLALIWISRSAPTIRSRPDLGPFERPPYLNSQVTLIVTWTVAVPASMGTAFSMAMAPPSKA